jgi:branched-chain amino acid transport system substrate-binding protein
MRVVGRAILAFRFVCGAAILSPGISVAAEKPFKIGVSVDLTGKFSAYGKPSKDGVEYAVAEWRRIKGDRVGSRPLEVIIKDSQSSAQPTISSFLEFFQKDKVDVLVGPTASGLVAAVVPLWKQTPDRPIWVEPGGTSGKVRELLGADDLFFHMHGWSSSYSSTIAKALASSLDPSKRRVAFLYSDGSYGRSDLPEAKRFFSEAGFQIVGEELMREGATDLSSVISKLKQSKPDVLFALVQTEDGIQVAKQLYQQKFQASVLIGLAQVPLKQWQEATGAAQKCWVSPVSWLPGSSYLADKAEPDLFPSAAQWESDYEKATGKVPEFITVMHYVTVINTLLAAERAGKNSDRETLAAEIAKSNYNTPFGHLNFVQSGATKYQAFGEMIAFQRQETGDGNFKNVIFFPAEAATGQLQLCNP